MSEFYGPQEPLSTPRQAGNLIRAAAILFRADIIGEQPVMDEFSIEGTRMPQSVLARFPTVFMAGKLDEFRPGGVFDSIKEVSGEMRRRSGDEANDWFVQEVANTDGEYRFIVMAQDEISGYEPSDQEMSLKADIVVRHFFQSRVLPFDLRQDVYYEIWQSDGGLPFVHLQEDQSGAYAETNSRGEALERKYSQAVIDRAIQDAESFANSQTTLSETFVEDYKRHLIDAPMEPFAGGFSEDYDSTESLLEDRRQGRGFVSEREAEGLTSVLRQLIRKI